MIRKKHILDHKERFDFGLFGIASSENDYRMVWLLNNQLGFNLHRQDDLEIFHKKLNEPQLFPQFSFHDEKTLLHYRLLGNKTENGYLLEEMRKVDYLLQVSGDFTATHLTRLVKSLNAVREISLAFPIDPGNLKSGVKLLQ